MTVAFETVVESPHVEQRRFLKPDEARAVIAAAGKIGRCGVRDKALLQLAYRHGLRASEACGMKWSQIDLKDGTIFVKRAKMGKASTHTMDADEVRLLKKLKANDKTNSPFVFLSERGGQLSPDMLARICERAGRAAGLDLHVHPHMLRHGAGYNLINNGIDVRFVQDFLGHKSIQSTALYTALAPSTLASVRVR